MKETLQSYLLELCALHGAASGMGLGALGKAALKDHTFFNRVERGDGFNVTTFDRVVQWFSDNWPDGAKWPDDIPRPEQSRAAEPASEPAT